MKKIISKAMKGLAGVKTQLLAYGAFGLFAIAMLDSALVPLPGGPDAAMILLTTMRPNLMLLYALAATLGSVAGCLILYSISMRAGRRALSKFSESKQARARDLIERYDVLSVLIASILPPPFPFKLFVISAGVFRLNVLRFALAIGVGRAFRYLLEGYLAARYGSHAGEILAKYYPFIGVGLAVVIILGFAIRSLRRRSGDDELIQPAEEVSGA